MDGPPGTDRPATFGPVGRTPATDWRTAAVVRRGGLAVAIEAVSSLLTIGVVVAIQRSLPAGSLGVYGVASAVGVLFLIVGSLGTSHLVVREVALGSDAHQPLSVGSLWARAVFVAVVSGPVVILSPSIAFGFFVLSTVANLFIDLASAVLRGIERYVAAGIVGLAYRLLMLAVVLGLGHTEDLTLVAAVMFVATVVSGLVSVFWAFSRAKIRLAGQRPRDMISTLRAHWAEAVALNLYQVAYGATSRVDVLIVGALVGSRGSTGYVAAAVLGAGLANLAYTFVGFVLPRLSSMGSDHVARESRRIARIAFVSFAACAVPAVFLVHPLIETLYGHAPRLADTPTILAIFIAAFPFIAATRVLLAGFIAVRRPSPVLAVQLSGTAWLAAFVVIGYEVLSLEGAAIGSASSDVLMLGLAILGWHLVPRKRASVDPSG